MKYLICGDRNWADAETIREFIDSLPAGSVIIHGDCRGVDRIAGTAAAARGLDVRAMSANWEAFGRSAGPIRNTAMLQLKPDECVAFHDDLGRSLGTKDMLAKATKAGIPVRVISSKSKANPQ